MQPEVVEVHAMLAQRLAVVGNHHDGGSLIEPEAGEGAEKKSLLPVGAYLSVSEGENVSAGQVVAKIPREASKTKDITGGLPRVAELFEARKPKDACEIAKIDGTVSMGGTVREGVCRA